MRIRLILLASCILGPTALRGEEPTAAAQPVDWAQLLEETRAAEEFVEDPLADLVVLPEPKTNLFFAGGVAAGRGYSGNYLKRSQAVASAYTRLEGTAMLNWFLPKSSLTAFAFAEANVYDADGTASDEFMVFSQATWVHNRATLDYGLEAEVFYGDQIYDASLSVSSRPAGARLRQFMPRGRAYADWFAGRLDRLRLGGSFLWADYDEDAEDYYEPVAELEWEHLWRKGLTTQLALSASRQRYSEETGRTALGLPTTERKPLRVDRIELEPSVKWNPPTVKWLQLSASAGYSWNDDRSGEFESRTEAWLNASVRLAYKWGHLRVNGRWMEREYDARRVSFFTTVTELQDQRQLKAELKRNLPWDLALYLRAEWNELDSRSAGDSFLERRGEVLIEWNY